MARLIRGVLSESRREGLVAYNIIESECLAPHLLVLGQL
jgi:hypothetical protein